MAMKPGIMWMGSINPPVWHGKELQPVELFKLLSGMGCEGIDIFARSAEQHGVDTLKAALDESGLACSCYYISADLVGEDPEKVEAADDAFPRGIEQAQALGAPVCFTHGSQHAHAGGDNLTRYIDRLGEKLALFEGTDMTLVIENAGTLVHSADHMMSLMDVLADEGLRQPAVAGRGGLGQRQQAAIVHDEDEPVGDQEGPQAEAVGAALRPGEVAV